MVGRISEGVLPIRQGSIYWKRNTVTEDENARPTLLLIHAGVADHTMWDAQVEFLNSKGWNCLRFDMFGYGRSNASEQYLHSNPREPFDPSAYIDQLRQNVLGQEANIIVIGLSIGANISLGYTLSHPQHVLGLALCAGGPPGFEHPNDPAEDQLFAKVESLINIGDVQGAAQLLVRIWGDGPLQEPGRLAHVAEDVEARMLAWNTEIAARECSKRGAGALQMVTQDPPPIARLHTVGVPTAVCWGTFDETFSTQAMKFVAQKIGGSTSREFRTAHMINLERPEEFNEFIHGWLEKHFDG